ncbi:Intramembrane protease RasP/YluC, implicated in cell division based on FtsL cleavage [hydrothermal vent metagenome]|uniref:Intramembrane protease RasP/YluC, implicated in cell division based on FtsL cleavage n=1 Tax=hydrothermal vent metagenome TaxID=652676 RepID=A0A3B0V6H3_9ZZZZ
MTTIISFLLVLGILIFIHELGHFAVAKFAGVGVEKFSLGFGPRLLKYKYGETEYCLSVIPFGGFVKMVGESPDEEVSEADKKKSFTHKPLLARVAIVSAGATMNLVLAAVLFPVIFMIGVEVPAYMDKAPEVGYVIKGEAGDRAGLEQGDIIKTIDGNVVTTWEKMYKTIALNPERPVDISLDRGGKTVSTVLTPEASEELGIGVGGFYPPMTARVGALSSGSPAEKAGLQVGDIISKVDGNEIEHWSKLQALVSGSDKERIFTILRDGRAMDVAIVPEYNKDTKTYLIGVAQGEEMVLKKYGLVDSIRLGTQKAGELTVLLFKVLGRLVSGDLSLKSLGGPIMIAQVAGKAASSGVTEILSLLAFLSLQLGIINLFPVPVLDGGHLFFYAIEAVRGKPLSERVQGIAQYAGMVLLIALMVFVTWNDLWRIFGARFG